MTTQTGQDDYFAQAGGMEGLREILRTFYDAVFEDTMIGYLFWNSDKERLIRTESEMAARMLGASHIKYTGKALRPVHAKHRILGGHFLRRQVLLRQAWEAHDLPMAVQDVWQRHSEALRPLVTADDDSSCSHERAEQFAAQFEDTDASV